MKTGGATPKDSADLGSSLKESLVRGRNLKERYPLPLMLKGERKKH
jgi:hypothetical protein